MPKKKERRKNHRKSKVLSRCYLDVAGLEVASEAEVEEAVREADTAADAGAGAEEGVAAEEAEAEGEAVVACAGAGRNTWGWWAGSAP
jgi:hypothetical protein